MPKHSALFNLYQERISRCKSPDELLKLSKEITTKSFKGNEKLALTLACIFAAKWFDKHGCAPSKAQLEGGDLDV